MTGNSYTQKDLQKHDQAVTNKETGWCGDWLESDKLSSIVWAALFIWGGVILLASNVGWLASLGAETTDSHWVIFFLGAGSIVVLEVLIRLLTPSIHNPELISYLFIILAFGIASGTLGYIWPLFLIAIGASILWGIRSRGGHSVDESLRH
jgi:drug/metabolite transporter (DMT)-like permease